jgi:hypothetical protein
MTNADWSSLIEETAHLLALPFLTPPSRTKQPTGTASVVVNLVKVNGTTEQGTAALRLLPDDASLTVDMSDQRQVRYPLIYLERANSYALVRRDGIVHLTVELDGSAITGRAIGYGSPRLNAPTNDSPFFTFHGTFAPSPPPH